MRGSLKRAVAVSSSSGVAPDLLEQFRRAEATDSSAVEVFPGTELVGESSSEAYAAALDWRARNAGRKHPREGEENA